MGGSELRVLRDCLGWVLSQLICMCVAVRCLLRGVFAQRIELLGQNHKQIEPINVIEQLRRQLIGLHPIKELFFLKQHGQRHRGILSQNQRDLHNLFELLLILEDHIGNNPEHGAILRLNDLIFPPYDDPHHNEEQEVAIVLCHKVRPQEVGHLE